MKPRSTAVAAHRTEPPDSLDFFPTPPWATRAFCVHVAPRLGIDPGALVWEPACGQGHMLDPLRETYPLAWGTDIFPYGGNYTEDFLASDDRAYEWIITNPPFNAAIAFARHGLELARHGVCLLLRTQWLHTIERYELFLDHPPTLIAYYVERVPMHRGRWEPGGKTATDYCWVSWRKGAAPMPPMWIPPGCRKALTKPDDAARFGSPVAMPLLEQTPGEAA